MNTNTQEWNYSNQSAWNSLTESKCDQDSQSPIKLDSSQALNCDARGASLSFHGSQSVTIDKSNAFYTEGNFAKLKLRKNDVSATFEA